MNKVVTYGLIFTGGAAVGGGISWFITKKHYEKTMDEQIAAESEENRKMYEDLMKQEQGETDIACVWQLKNEESKPEPESTTTTSRLEDIGEQVVESYTDRMNRRKADLLRPERVRYDTFSKPQPESEDKEVDEVRLKQNDDNPRTDIYVINADQFAHERYGFDKVTLYWWELERILSEEDMDILDVPDLLGTNWESHIGEEEKDIVYVRNEPLETDYEVVVQHESFYAMRD